MIEKRRKQVFTFHKRRKGDMRATTAMEATSPMTPLANQPVDFSVAPQYTQSDSGYSGGGGTFDGGGSSGDWGSSSSDSGSSSSDCGSSSSDSGGGSCGGGD